MSDRLSLLRLLQLVSPALPVGAYSYSEGLESLVDRDTINNQESLNDWIRNEVQYGAIRVETAVMARIYRSIEKNDVADAIKWNEWLSATRETEELRQQSWQMGRSLLKLLIELEPKQSSLLGAIDFPCNYAVAFGIAAVLWQIDLETSTIGYLQSWASNLISAGVRLIPLGQTAGQQILFRLHPFIVEATSKILCLKDEQLSSCSWGLALASMERQLLHTRLFRS